MYNNNIIYIYIYIYIYSILFIYIIISFNYILFIQRVDKAPDQIFQRSQKAIYNRQFAASGIGYMGHG